MPPRPSIFGGAHHFLIDHPVVYSTAGNQYNINVWSVQTSDLVCRLNPILDASHTRNRKRSPPDSECFPGTREEPIQEIVAWANSGETFLVCTRKAVYWWDPPTEYTAKKTPHVYWLHGFAGCGKSSISLAIAKIYAGSGRLLASYFFFRGAGDRSTMNRFAVTLSCQLLSALPATAPFIEAAVRAEPGIVTGDASLETQLDLLVLSPFLAVVSKDVVGETLAKGPFLIVIDGLDECDDKQGVEAFITHILGFFEAHPTVPLRLFVSSRVEQHIRACLETDKVHFGNLDHHSSQGDIERFLEASFSAVAEKDLIIRAYVRTRGSWPTKSDMGQLVRHVRGSFVLASTVFKYISRPPTKEDPSTPMERLPLSMKMNGLDGLYAETLLRSLHLPHFHPIISTLALLRKPLPIVEISALLGIEAFEVVRVLLNLQAIIHVPGIDGEGAVTLCHTSLRDYLTTESRSGCFFVPTPFHLHLSYYCFSSAILRGTVEDGDYRWMYFDSHWDSFANSEASDFSAEIERFKSCQPLLVDRLPCCAFLCSMFFYTFFLAKPQRLDEISFPDLLGECINQLTLAVASTDSHIRVWLEKKIWYGASDSQSTVQITPAAHETLQHELQRVSLLIRTNFPELVESQNHYSGEDKVFVFDGRRVSGTGLFNALQWIVARANVKWGELNVSPHRSLELFTWKHSGDMKFSFDGIPSNMDDIYWESESSDSDY